MQEYIVKLKDKLTISGTNEEKNIIDMLSQDTYEKRFPISDLDVESYLNGSLEESEKFIDDIQDKNIKNQFQIVKKDDL